MGNFYNILKDFVTPISIAAITLVVGYFLTRRSDNIKNKRDLNSKRVTLIDTILLEIGRLNSILEILRVDAERNMFMLTNTETAKQSIVNLKRIFDDVTVLPDENLRKRILVDIDLVDALIRDIVSIETMAINENNKFSVNEKDSLKELRKLKLALLKKDIGLDLTVNPINLIFLKVGMTLTDEKIKAIKDLYNDLNQTYLKASNERNNSTAWCKDKRIFYCMRIIDIEAKLRELEFILNEERDQLTPTS